jgi:RNA polymerase sigma-70 factor, ECF subfamily
MAQPPNGEGDPVPSPHDVTALLAAWGDGDREALDDLLPLVYAELRRLAHARMRGERGGHSLQTTALVNEAYLRLVDYRRVRARDRSHFLAIAAQAMRRILIERARARSAVKRDGGAALALEAAADQAGARAGELVALDEALTRLAGFDARKAQVVELKYFGGLTNDETAEALEISGATVEREWSAARAWLRSAIAEP